MAGVTTESCSWVSSSIYQMDKIAMVNGIRTARARRCSLIIYVKFEVNHLEWLVTIELIIEIVIITSGGISVTVRAITETSAETTSEFSSRWHALTHFKQHQDTNVKSLPFRGVDCSLIEIVSRFNE